MANTEKRQEPHKSCEAVACYTKIAPDTRTAVGTSYTYHVIQNTALNTSYAYRVRLSMPSYPKDEKQTCLTK